MRIRSWQQSSFFAISSVLAVLSGFALFIDAASFGLRPANSMIGRVKGCYTIIDDLLGTITPLDWARPVELAFTLFPFVAGWWCGRQCIRAARSDNWHTRLKITSLQSKA